MISNDKYCANSYLRQVVRCSGGLGFSVWGWGLLMILAFAGVCYSKFSRFKKKL